MTKSSNIIIRVDADLKACLTAAANQRGVSITGFLVGLAERELKKMTTAMAKRAKEPGTRGARGGHAPTWWRLTCLTASRGGEHGYKSAGANLVGALANAEPCDMDLTADEWQSRLETVREGLLGDWTDEQALAWFDENLPAYMRHVPRRRRQLFIDGVVEEVRENGIPI